MATYFASSNNQREGASMIYFRESLPGSYPEAPVPPGNVMMYMNSGSYSDALAASSQQQNNCIDIQSMEASDSTPQQQEIFSNLGGTRSGEHEFNAWRDNRNDMLVMHPMGGSTGMLHSGQNLQGQGLSLSLGTQIPSGIQMPSISYRNPNSGFASFLGSNSSISADGGRNGSSRDEQTRTTEYFPPGISGGNQDGKGDLSSYGMPCTARAIPSSKYLKAAQQLLDEVVNVRKDLKQPDGEKNQTTHEQQMKNSKNGDGGSKDTSSNAQESASNIPNELSHAEIQELQNKLTKLLSMLDEVDRRYKHYYHQMQIVVSSFDVIAGCGAAKPYTALALQTISRHFRCLRDAICCQIRATRKSLGEQDNSDNSKGITRLRYVDQQLRQQRAIQQLGMMQQHAWRPQRGLPESSVSILRAWLFEHFLHPYPKDSDKILLARQTGLTRSQVSNWFINARVRLWKPMVEEMYKEEFADEEMDSNSSSENAAKAIRGDMGTSERALLSNVAPTSYWCVNKLLPRFAFPFLSHQRHPHTHTRFTLTKPISLSHMDSSKAFPPKEVSSGLDATSEEEYTSLSKLLQEFTAISSIDKAWTFNSGNGTGTQAMFSISQPNLLANKRKKFMLSTVISKENENSVTFQWAPFPVEMTGASAVVPSPSGSKLLVVRNPENESPTQFEMWSQSQLEKEFHVPQTVHGSVYVDGWFEGISWNSDETLIAYVAEEPSPSKPTFSLGNKKGDSLDKDCNSWKAQGDWEEDWGETYAGKRQPSLFVININSGEVQAVKGVPKSLSVGQVVWAPMNEGLHQYLVFVGWSSATRKLGIKYCYNRACALYAVRVSLYKSEANELELTDSSSEELPVVNLTQSISSAFFPRFSPDGNFLVFLSAKSSVESGAHSATDSLHRIDWPTDGKLSSSKKIVDVIPVVQFAEDDCFPGLYCSSILSNPWLSDGCTMILSSIWHSSQVLISVNVLSGELLRISSAESNFSWNVLTLDGDNIIAVSSSPVDVPQIKYGYLVDKANKDTWSWLSVSSPIIRCSEKVTALLSSLQFSIMKIPVKGVSANLPKGAQKPFEAIFVSSSHKKDGACDPLIVVLHGGPHSVSLSSFSKSLAFLSSIGYSLLIVNYRGSLGFGEEALQSLPGKIGSQDVIDVLTAIDHVIDMGLANPSKITVVGGSHGGFLTTHLIGQAPDKFVAAVARNPVCNLALMVGTTDIPDWCYVESYGTKGKDSFTESPSVEDLAHFHSKSPISHISKVKTPILFLLGAQDLRVPVSNGLQYARALKEKGVETKLIVFPNDVHGIERPQSDFESFLNIGLWFKKYCKGAGI